MKKIIFFILVFILSSSGFAKEKISVYTYHAHAPFITDKNSGLTFNLINFLNKNSNDKFEFILKTVPRSRLNYILKPWINKNCSNVNKKCNPNWLVLWVNHKWGFGQDALDNFSWTPLLEDSNAIISSKQKKIEYTKPEDLIGKKLAGVSGHKYIGIDDLVNEGKINRINGSNEVDNLRVTLANRVDVTLLPKSAFDYYKKINSDFKTLYVSKIPHQKYMRNIMSSGKNKDLLDYLNSLNFKDIGK